MNYHTKLKEHFGLVWDGEEIETIAGTTGEYLRYNSPHKASLYIVSGLPLIVWKESAIYELVKQYNIGFGVSNLMELDENFLRLQKMNTKHGRRILLRLAETLATGKNLEETAQKILDV